MEGRVGQANLQESHRKHEHNLEFGAERGLEIQHLRDRKGNNPGIQHNIQGCCSEYQGIRLHAFPFVFPIPAIPVVTDGRALEPKSDQESDAVTHCDNAGNFDNATHPIGRKYSEVEQEEADLRDGDAGDVEDFLDVEKL